MYWRVSIDQLFEPSSAAATPQISFRDVIVAVRNFTNPLWPAPAPATPASAGAQGDQGNYGHA